MLRGKEGGEGGRRWLRAKQCLSTASGALTEREKGKTKRGFTGTKNSRHERIEGAGERDPDKGWKSLESRPLSDQRDGAE